MTNDSMPMYQDTLYLGESVDTHMIHDGSESQLSRAGFRLLQHPLEEHHFQTPLEGKLALYLKQFSPNEIE